MIWGDLLGAAGTSQLPGDLIIQIVLRLPVKSILRFKSVYRAWYFLFNHPIFIQHHCRITSSFAEMNNLLSFFVHTKRNEQKDAFSSLLLDRSCSGRILIDDLELAFEGDYLHVLGSINGLVCLTLERTSFVLWNPATRKHSLIPNPQLSLGSGECESVLTGFAFDSKTDTYKVVKVLFFDDLDVAATARVEIYSTGTNTWRTTKIVGFPENFKWREFGVVVGGDLFWLSPYTTQGSNLQQLILSFDASSEAFRFHPVPPVSPSDKPYPLGLLSIVSWRLDAVGEHHVLMYCEFKHGLHGGSICIERVNIRTLNKSDEGGTDSFHIDKLAVEPLPDLKGIVRICRNGKIIAKDLHEKLLIYDREEIIYLPRELCCEHAQFYDYTESLVWPSTLA